MQTTLCNIITKNGWPKNPSRRVPLLYLFGKAILLRGTVLWRPIAANVEPRTYSSFTFAQQLVHSHYFCDSSEKRYVPHSWSLKLLTCNHGSRA